MQILAVSVYSHEGKRRDLRLMPGRLNILTGRSKTGKSAVLDLVEFCLGRDEVTLPLGIISEAVSWYATLVQIGSARLLLARPNPETATTSRAMMLIGDSRLDLPDYSALRVNADTTVLREQLSERLGIESFRVEQRTSLRSSFDVSVRQALFYSFQKQTEIASQQFLFHRQGEEGIAATIRETLPYFLGAIDPERVVLRQQFLQARRILRRTRRELEDARALMDEQDSRHVALIRDAADLGLIPANYSQGPLENVRGLLELALNSPQSQVDNRQGERLPGVDGSVSRRRALLDERRRLRAEYRDLSDSIDLLRGLRSEQEDFDDELRYQSDRLQALELMPRTKSEGAHREDICPLCLQEIENPDPSIDLLNSLREEIGRSLATSGNIRPRREAELRSLYERRDQLRDEIRVNLAQLNALVSAGNAASDADDISVRRAFLQGRIAQELDRGIFGDDRIATLTQAEEAARLRVESLQALIDDDSVDARMDEILRQIGADLTNYSRYLQLENSEHYIRLDPDRLTVSAVTPGGVRPLTRVGSAENWIGYHLAVHLALHKWFVSNGRPVPRFVMFDQPTQAFFPEEVADAAEIEDADWQAVRRQFKLMNDVVNELEGELQVIVCDHANLTDDWFQNAVVDNWRRGVALIPVDWIAAE
ncbi:DUF3732 domain-containing protein [Amycolatopsis granulosa]|uniref:DUF3732 domain-containing protein n=1 Tax=Amycolatopsis granulosa TaxID=185684 RepID=UPI00141EBC50|nr:DUF3732 domain-containing protein [Amycolatopsis granulosa]NIH84594.1 hypothetical protein [Amycolatopsis granulosa]